VLGGSGVQGANLLREISPLPSSFSNGGEGEKSNGATISLADICMVGDFRFAPVAQKV
jgi:hypothetical protein